MNAAEFRRPWWMLSGHVETIAAMRDDDELPYQSEVIQTRDKDELLINWIVGKPDRPLLIIFHGLEGCAQSHTVRTIAKYFMERQWSVAAPHFRSCGHMNLLPRAYHAADGAETRWLMEYFCATFRRPRYFAAGVSLGGNAMIHGLDAATVPVEAAATISAPLDLTAAAHSFDGGLNHWLYGRHFVKLLRAKVQRKAARYPAICDAQKLRKVRTIGDFDRLYTAPVHGFADAEEYWRKGSTTAALLRMQTRLLCINAGNDPMVPAASLPHTASPQVSFCRPQHGGHGAFYGNPTDWLGQTVHNFFTGRETMSGAPAEIFKANDIRGIYGDTLTEDGARWIGRALAAAVLDAGGGQIALARDGRLSSPALAAALAAGINAGGVEVIDIGLAPTPALYYAAYTAAGGNGAMVTGSHNPPDHNGVKMLINGKILPGTQVNKTLDNLPVSTALAACRRLDIKEEYMAAICAVVTSTPPLHLIVDAGNGATGNYAPELYRRLGHRVSALFCEVDGTFPNHHPDPAQPENLRAARAALNDENADMALVFDGDGDRLGVLLAGDEDWVFPDRLLMLLAQDMLVRHPGARVVFDVKCSAHLAPWIVRHGGIADMQPTGHAFIKARMAATGALLGGEMSGHFYFAENWRGFDDALLAGAKLAAIFATAHNPLAALPKPAASPEIVLPIYGQNGQNLIATLRAEAKFAGACRIITLDGLRVEYADGFGLVRASNTTASLVLRFEGDDEPALQRIKSDFADALSLVNLTL